MVYGAWVHLSRLPFRPSSYFTPAVLPRVNVYWGGGDTGGSPESSKAKSLLNRTDHSHYKNITLERRLGSRETSSEGQDPAPRHRLPVFLDLGAELAVPSLRCKTPQMLSWGPSRLPTLATLGIRCFPAAVEAAMSAAAEPEQPRHTPEPQKTGFKNELTPESRPTTN